MTKADKLIKDALVKIGLNTDSQAKDKYDRVYDLVEALEEENRIQPIPVGTTGTITDRICEWALESVGGDFDYRLTANNVKWLGDYALLGFPLNIIISVKSFKAKERLLMSGTGSQLVPTIGFGLFDDPSEFSAKRLISYRMRGFLCIYMPKGTWSGTKKQAQEFLNWNGSKLLRPLEQFPSDLENARIQVEMGGVNRTFIDPLRI